MQPLDLLQLLSSLTIDQQIALLRKTIQVLEDKKKEEELNHPHTQLKMFEE